MRTTQGEADRVLNQFAYRRGLLNRRAAAGKGEELLREIAGPHRSVLGVIETGAHLVVRRQEEGREGNIADDRGEEVIEVVSNSTGEQAELFQRLGFASLGFIALTFGDVAENKDHAGDFILGIADGR